MNNYTIPPIISDLPDFDGSITFCVSQLALCESLIPVADGDKAVLAPMVFTQAASQGLIKALLEIDRSRVAMHEASKKSTKEGVTGFLPKSAKVPPKRSDKDTDTTSCRAFILNPQADRAMFVRHMNDATEASIVNMDTAGYIADVLASTPAAALRTAHLRELSNPHNYAQSSVRSSATGGCTDVSLDSVRYVRTFSIVSEPSIAALGKVVTKNKNLNEILLLRNSTLVHASATQATQDLAKIVMNLRSSPPSYPDVGGAQRMTMADVAKATSISTPRAYKLAAKAATGRVTNATLMRYIERLVQVSDILEHGAVRSDTKSRAEHMEAMLRIGLDSTTKPDTSGEVPNADDTLPVLGFRALGILKGVGRVTIEDFMDALDTDGISVDPIHEDAVAEAFCESEDSVEIRDGYIYCK